MRIKLGAGNVIPSDLLFFIWTNDPMIAVCPHAPVFLKSYSIDKQLNIRLSWLWFILVYSLADSINCLLVAFLQSKLWLIIMEIRESLESQNNAQQLLIPPMPTLPHPKFRFFCDYLLHTNRPWSALQMLRHLCIFY